MPTTEEYLARKPEAGQVWRHYKTRHEYAVLGLGSYEPTLEAVVIYKSIAPDSSGDVWVRPLSVFLSRVEHGDVDRFERMS